MHGRDIEDHDIERELYFAMEEETDGLGTPELDLGRMRRAGRRRTALVAGGSAAALVVGVGAAFAVGYDRGKHSGRVLADHAAPVLSTMGATPGSTVSAAPAVPVPSDGSAPYVCLIGGGGVVGQPLVIHVLGPGAPGQSPPAYIEVAPTVIDGTPRPVVTLSPPPYPTSAPSPSKRTEYMAPCTAVLQPGLTLQSGLGYQSSPTQNPSGAPTPSAPGGN